MKTINYKIFVPAERRWDCTYFQNERRGQKAIHFTGTHAQLVEFVEGLKAQGTHICSVCTELGYDVKL